MWDIKVNVDGKYIMRLEDEYYLNHVGYKGIKTAKLVRLKNLVLSEPCGI